MPRYLIKIKDKYFEWSTIVDAPLTYGMNEDELKFYIKEKYGNEGLAELPARLERVEKQGTSCHFNYTLEDIGGCNRAGNKEKSLTIDEIYEKYANQPEN